MKVIFICGLGGDAGMTYVENLKTFCINRGYKFYVPRMPAFGEEVSYQKYKEAFEKTVCENKIENFDDVLVIAQSAGTNFAVKYFANNPTILKGYISCAGFYNGADKQITEETKNKLAVLESFYPTQEEYAKFKNLAFDKYSIYGGKDCFFTEQNLQQYADNIGAKSFFDKDGYHCTISENIKTHYLLHTVIEKYF